jgi:CHASE2 domain-containing sensor protein
VNFKAVTENKWFKPALGAALTVACGLLLWATPLGESWENASYDYLFRFGSRAVTNKLALILMDEDSYTRLSQNRDAHWDRVKHTELLNKLTAGSSALVVFDVLFRTENPETDSALGEAIHRNAKVVLMADVEDPLEEHLAVASLKMPRTNFLEVAAAWGVGKVEGQTGGTPRRHWPFGTKNDDSFHSLAWAAASVSGAHLDERIEQRWLRCYGEHGGWEPISYHSALAKPPEFFRDKIIFIGNSPERTDPGFPERDKFRTPYTRWNGKSIGGVEILATTFLNLVNGDWLRRPAPAVEFLLLVIVGGVIGGGLCQLPRWKSVLAAATIALAVTFAFVSWSYYTNYWFPWLIIAGGQIPCAFAFAWIARVPQVAFFLEKFPGYTPIGAPFGEGAYGKVWLVRNEIGQLQALKQIERGRFKDNGPYDREFRGIKNYKPVSNQHPGLLHIDHVNRNERAGYFYYVMELGDPLDPDWLKKDVIYQPRDLAAACSRSPGARLSVRESLRVAIALLEALDYLHSLGLVHRDIKPSNIIFVNGRPKFADIGLVREVGPEVTLVGTEFYMPPLPENPGTPQADIYALGMLLYVISTGKHPREFADLSTTLAGQSDFMRLNTIFCRACHPSADERYASAKEMLAALRETQRELDSLGTVKV